MTTTDSGTDWIAVFRRFLALGLSRYQSEQACRKLERFGWKPDDLVEQTNALLVALSVGCVVSREGGTVAPCNRLLRREYDIVSGMAGYLDRQAGILHRRIAAERVAALQATQASTAR